MAHENSGIPLGGIPAPRDVADAVDLLMVVLLWLEANDHPFAAIDVNSAMDRLLTNQSG